MDVAIEVPSDELTSVTSHAMWEEIFDKLAAYTESHRSTLVFVNTRKLVERVSFALAERLGIENVARASRFALAQLAARCGAAPEARRDQDPGRDGFAGTGHRYRQCRSCLPDRHARAPIAVAMQRVGRAGHWRGAIPKGRLFATTRDDLLEQAALVRKMRTGELDLLEIPPQPIDVLMQQIVAACGAEPWDKASLFRSDAPRLSVSQSDAGNSSKRLSRFLQRNRSRAAAAMAHTCCMTAFMASCIRGAARA